MSAWFDNYGFAVIDGRLVTGAQPSDAGDVARLVTEAGVSRVVNLCQDVEYEAGERAAVAAAYAAAGVEERRIDLVDFGHVRGAALDEAVTTTRPWFAEGATVYVHCRAGWQRSATVAAAVLAVRDGIGVDEALHRIRTRKPSAQPLHHQLEGLHAWWRKRAAGAA